MAENYEYFYSGSSSSLEPSYGDLFSGYRLSASSLGAPTSTQTADQIREVSARLNEGIKTVELQPMAEGVFDTIPKQHLQEINRLAKLTGIETSMHAPIIDPAGFTREGWSEVERENAERQILSIVERSHQLNPNGNIPVTIHASGLPGSEYAPQKKEYPGEETTIVAVDQETGQMRAAKRIERYYPGEDKRIISPREDLEMINRGAWSNQIMELRRYKKIADDTISPVLNSDIGLPLFKKAAGESLSLEEERRANAAQNELRKGDSFLRNTEAMVRGLYHEAYKFGNPEVKEELKRAAEEWKKATESASQASRGATPYERYSKIVSAESQALDRLIESMSVASPQIYKPIEEFVIEKAGKTLGNVAFKSFEKYREHAPIISVENVPVGMAISRAEDLKKLIEQSRKEFVKTAVKEGFSEGEAKKQAAKLIGATWDVGHINLLRKGGFGKETIVEETKTIAPYVKNVHLTDNFGYSDTHLPVGMGEVPTKEMLKELEKAGYSGKHIIEAGGFVAQFKTSPHPYVLEALGSPLYSAYMQPFWNQVRGTYGNYSAGYGTMLPEQHFSMYGAGFSSLPTEVGGQMPGKQSRFAGTPTE